MSAHVEQLAARIAKLSPADQLRLAADLIEQGRPDTGETLVRRVSATLAAHRLIAAAKAQHHATNRERP